MKIWAHRGASNLITENTLDAILKAEELGCRGIELDVRICGSGEPVVFHDPTLWRMCRKFIPIGSTSLEELQRISLDAKGRKIPTLREVLDALSTKTKVIIDLKGSTLMNADLERAVGECINVAGIPSHNNIIISAERPTALSKSYALFSRLNPVGGNEMPGLALILDKKIINLTKYSPYFFKYDAIHVCDKLATKRRIKRWKNLGMKVRVWTVNSPKRAEELAEMGVDAIFTDVPELLL